MIYTPLLIYTSLGILHCLSFLPLSFSLSRTHNTSLTYSAAHNHSRFFIVCNLTYVVVVAIHNNKVCIVCTSLSLSLSLSFHPLDLAFTCLLGDFHYKVLFMFPHWRSQTPTYFMGVFFMGIVFVVVLSIDLLLDRLHNIHNLPYHIHI